MREHYEHLAAAVGLLILAVLVSWFRTEPLFLDTSPAGSTAELTPLPPERSEWFATSTGPSIKFATSTFEVLFPTRPATTTKPTPTTPPVSPSKPMPKPVATSTPTAPQTDTLEPAELSRLRNSIVNILCISHVKPLRSTSGSGVIVDSRGIVLTVAHVAQSLLLEHELGAEKISCTIRTGSPAVNAYTARPIYVSEDWIKDNPTTLISSQPTGTGEHDYAFLAITGSAGKTIPSSFPAVALATTDARGGDRVYIGSYGAQDLTSTQVRTSLRPTLVESSVKTRYTFRNNTPDVLAISGSAASQSGSSGGAVVNADGQLIGLITTSEVTGDTASREMRVITPSYIQRSFKEDAGKTLEEYLGPNISTLVNSYAATVARLGDFLASKIGLK